jgi:hypothetical protein
MPCKQELLIGKVKELCGLEVQPEQELFESRLIDSLARVELASRV